MIKILIMMAVMITGLVSNSWSYCGDGIIEADRFTTWIGSQSTKASNPLNWSEGIIPFDEYTVIVNGTVPLEWDYSATIRNMDIQTTYEGKVTITADLNIAGSPDPVETCDDGNSDNYDGCNSCTLEYLGDGIVQTYLGEECDDANTYPYDGCNNNGILEYHGDGKIQHHLGEECDDGNGNLLDGCTPDGQLRYDCVNGKDCWVVYNPAYGICNVNEYGNTDPRVTQYFPIPDGLVSTSTFVTLTRTSNVRIIWCQGTWYLPEGEIQAYNLDFVGYDAPHIPNISWKHQDNSTYVYPPTLLGHLYTGYGETVDSTTWSIASTDTVMRPQSSNQNVLLVKSGGTVIYDRLQFFGGLVITGARGTACFTRGSDGSSITCDDAAGMRAYCTNGAEFRNNVFYDNVVGALVRDTDPNWRFDFMFSHNLFISNSMDGMRWNYGNSNIAIYNTFTWNHNTHLRIRDGKSHWVWANNFGWSGKYQVRLEAVMYPADVANQGTMLKWNNFIGSCYSPSWASFFDSCPTCGHWNQNYYKWYFHPYCGTEDDWDPNPLPAEHDMLFEYLYNPVL